MPFADPNCLICNGTGHVFEDDGRIVPARGRTCVCLRRAVDRLRHEAIWAQSNVPEKYRDATFEGFSLRDGTVIDKDPEGGNLPISLSMSEVDRDKRDRMAAIAETPLRDVTIILQGPYGAGKTYLAAALLREQVLRHGLSGYYTNFYGYLRRVRPDGAEAAEQRALRKKIRESDILILDDIGVEKASVFAMGELWEIIDERVGYNRATIVTSNVAAKVALRISDPDARHKGPESEEAFSIGERIYSRMRNRIVISWPTSTIDFREEQHLVNKAARLEAQAREVRAEIADGAVVRLEPTPEPAAEPSTEGTPETAPPAKDGDA
jgi:DNA replication protein DnaC